MAANAPARVGPSSLDLMTARLLSRLYRARPYTKAVPFAKTLATAADAFDLWVPGSGAVFEFGIMYVRCAVSADLQLADTNPNNIFLPFLSDNSQYWRYDLLPGYRSQQWVASKVTLLNPGGAVGLVKGVILGWEVTKEGYYR